MTKQDYVVFWHADYAECADFLYLRNLRDLRGKLARLLFCHLLGKLCDPLVIIQ